ncbi:MAG: hypothetical protein QM632_05505 [Micrococcaceae bacterium]
MMVEQEYEEPVLDQQQQWSSGSISLICPMRFTAEQKAAFKTQNGFNGHDAPATAKLGQWQQGCWSFEDYLNLAEGYYYWHEDHRSKTHEDHRSKTKYSFISSESTESIFTGPTASLDNGESIIGYGKQKPLRMKPHDYFASRFMNAVNNGERYFYIPDTAAGHNKNNEVAHAKNTMDNALAMLKCFGLNVLGVEIEFNGVGHDDSQLSYVIIHFSLATVALENPLATMISFNNQKGSKDLKAKIDGTNSQDLHQTTFWINRLLSSLLNQYDQALQFRKKKEGKLPRNVIEDGGFIKTELPDGTVVSEMLYPVIFLNAKKDIPAISKKKYQNTPWDSRTLWHVMLSEGKAEREGEVARENHTIKTKILNLSDGFSGFISESGASFMCRNVDFDERENSGKYDPRETFKLRSLAKTQLCFVNVLLLGDLQERALNMFADSLATFCRNINGDSVRINQEFSELTAQLLYIRNNYWFLQTGRDIEANRVLHAIQKTFNSPKLLTNLEEEISSVESFLASRQREEDEKDEKYRNQRDALFGFGGLIFAGLALWISFMAINYVDLMDSHNHYKWLNTPLYHSFGWILFVLIIAFVASWSRIYLSKSKRNKVKRGNTLKK